MVCLGIGNKVSLLSSAHVFGIHPRLSIHALSRQKLDEKVHLITNAYNCFVKFTKTYMLVGRAIVCVYFYHDIISSSLEGCTADDCSLHSASCWYCRCWNHYCYYLRRSGLPGLLLLQGGTRRIYRKRKTCWHLCCLVCFYHLRKIITRENKTLFYKAKSLWFLFELLVI